MKSNSTCIHCGKPITWLDGWGAWADKEEFSLDITMLFCDKSIKQAPFAPRDHSFRIHESKEERVIEILNKIDEI